MSIKRLEYKGNSRTEAHALVDFIDDSYLVILKDSIINDPSPHLAQNEDGTTSDWASWFTGLKIGGFLKRTKTGRWQVVRPIVCMSINECATLISGNTGRSSGLTTRGRTHISATPTYQKLLQNHIDKRK